MIVDQLTLPDDEIEKLFKQRPPTNRTMCPAAMRLHMHRFFLVLFLLHAS
jgi:hypothetical protein